MGAQLILFNRMANLKKICIGRVTDFPDSNNKVGRHCIVELYHNVYLNEISRKTKLVFIYHSEENQTGKLIHYHYF